MTTNQESIMRMEKRSVDEMDGYTLKRWISLIEGVHLITKQAERRGIDSDDVEFKQHHLVRFIDEHSERIKLV